MQHGSITVTWYYPLINTPPGVGPPTRVLSKPYQPSGPSLYIGYMAGLRNHAPKMCKHLLAACHINIYKGYHVWRQEAYLLAVGAGRLTVKATPAAALNYVLFSVTLP